MTEKVYLENPYLRQIDARIVDKKYVNNKYYIKTNKTIFYPNLAGGQPGDKGTINGIEVLDTYEEDHDIIHVLKDNVHSDKVQLSIDWENRFDYMQQHSGQHLLSSAFYKLYNGETVGFYIGKEYVYIDVDIPSISEIEVNKVEEFVNKIIFANFQIKSYVIEKGDMDKIPVRKNPIINSNIRIVEIDGIDFSPCCGTHLRNTGEIGLIKIRKIENYKGNIRVEFVCGNRALMDYTWKNKYIRDIGNLLSTKDKDVYDRVIKLYSQKESLEKENRILREELYEYKAQELLENARLIKGVNFICYKYEDMEFREINSIVSYLNSLENNILILGVHNKKQSNFIVSRSSNLNINMRIVYREIAKEIEIKGGGNSQTVQGACTKYELDLVLEKFYEKILNTI